MIEEDPFWAQVVDVLDRPDYCTVTFTQADVDGVTGAPPETLVVPILARIQMTLDTFVVVGTSAGSRQFTVDVLGGPISHVTTTCGSVTLESVEPGPPGMTARYVYRHDYPAGEDGTGCDLVVYLVSQEGLYFYNGFPARAAIMRVEILG